MGRVRPHPGGVLRHRAGRAPARGADRGGDRAHRPDDRPPHRLHRAHRGGAPVRDPRPAHRRPRRDPRHQRRRRPRAGPGRRPPHQGRALRPHRRVPDHRPAGLDRRAPVRLRGRALPGRAGLLRGEAGRSARHPGLFRRRLAGGHRGGGPPRRHLRPLGRDPGPGPRGRSRRSGPRPRRTGAHPRFSLSFRPILAETEDAAWARAEDILARTRATRAAQGLGPAAAPQNEGSRRLLAAAAQGTRLDTRLYTAIARGDRGVRATPPPWSARPSRSPRRCSTITTSACAPS